MLLTDTLKLAASRSTARTRANFQTKFIQSKSYNQSIKENNIAPFVLFDRPDPPFSTLEKAEQLYNGIDNTNVNINGFKKDANSDELQFLALSDFWQSYHFDPVTLETYAQVNPTLPTEYHLKAYVPLPSTSHPVQEKGQTSFVSFVSYMNPLPFSSNYINLIRINTATQTRKHRFNQTRTTLLHALSGLVGKLCCSIC